MLVAVTVLLDEAERFLIEHDGQPYRVRGVVYSSGLGVGIQVNAARIVKGRERARSEALTLPIESLPASMQEVFRNPLDYGEEPEVDDE